MLNSNKINIELFCELSGVQISDLTPNFINKIANLDLHFSFINKIQENHFIQEYKKIIFEDDLKKSGRMRLGDWESGWNENLEIYKNNSSELSLIPKYIKKSSFFRINGKLAESSNEYFEYILAKLHHQAIALKFLKEFDSIYEFGCGTGLNLISFNEVLPSKKYIGLDWCESSKSIINEVKKNNDINLTFETFNFFEPRNISFDKNSAVCTITSLEQVGEEFKNFIDLLVKERPGIVIHIEPIVDWYNMDSELESLSVYYHKKRGYLDGLVGYLEELESKKRISILAKFKTKFGESRHNPFSLIVWKPNS
jgi:hypothetical protein